MPKTLKKPMDKIVILTDLGRLVAYKILTDPNGLESPRAEIISCLECPDAYTKTSERVSDSAGRFRRAGKVANGTRAGYGEQHNMKTENKRRLVKMAAEHINKLLSAEGCPPWHLAAAKGINNTLVNSLAPPIRAMLKKNLKADLTNLKKAEVISRFIN